MKLVGQPYSSKQTFCLDFLLKVPLFLTTEGLMEDFPGGSVVRIHLPVQEMWVWSLDQENLTVLEATKPTHHKLPSFCLESGSCNNYWAHRLQILTPKRPSAHAPQQEKPPRWEGQAPQLAKSPCSSKDPAQPKLKDRLEFNGWFYLHLFSNSVKENDGD